MNQRNRGFATAFGGSAKQTTELATEDWNSFKNKVSNFMSRFQSDFSAVFRDTTEVKEKLVKLQQQLSKKKGEVRADAPTIKMRAYAKWLAKEGRMLSSAEDILNEITHSLPLIALFDKPWWDAYTNMLEYAELKVLRIAGGNPQEARARMRDTFKVNYPKSFDSHLTKNKVVENPIDEQKANIRCSDIQLGDWFAGDFGVHWGYVDGHWPMTARQKSPLKEVDLDIMSKDMAERVLAQIDKLLENFSNDDYKEAHRAMERLWRAAEPYSMENELEGDEHGNIWYTDKNMVALMAEIEGYVQHLLNISSHNDAQSYSLHTCMVVLAWVEQSLKRMD